MIKLSAGLLMYRTAEDGLEYFLVHPGGPFFRKKELGFWTIPKGIPNEQESLMDAAQREFLEETGITPTPPYYDLGNIKQKGGKIVHAWAFTGAWAPEQGIHCNTFSMEWPPRSGKTMTFPEVDKAGWFNYLLAVRMLIPEQIPFLDRAKALV